MKAYVVVGALLVGMLGIACGSSDTPCENVADCVEAGHSCSAGQELFCNQSEGGVCDCAGGTGGTGGTGGSGGNGAPETCADCVGTNVGPPGAPNIVVSCEPSGEQFACTCLDAEGASYTVYMSEAGCF